MREMFNRDDEGHISYLDEYLIQRQTIQRDNDLKEYVLDRFLDMCVEGDAPITMLKELIIKGHLG